MSPSEETNFMGHYLILKVIATLQNAEKMCGDRFILQWPLCNVVIILIAQYNQLFSLSVCVISP